MATSEALVPLMFWYNTSITWTAETYMVINLNIQMDADAGKREMEKVLPVFDMGFVSHSSSDR